jgi:uncharacterized membrane protein
VIEFTMFLLCAIGFYASAFMFRKSRSAAQGHLAEPSVVQSPRAKVVGGLPNAVIGLVYYAGVAASVPFLHVPPVWTAALAASLTAAAMSLYLAYSLLYVTRMPCVYCWTAHGVNLALPLALLAAHRLG